MTVETSSSTDDASERMPFYHRLRPRIFAVGLMSGIVAAACGGIGLHYINRITETIAVSSEVTAPLLADALALSQAGTRARVVVHGVREKCAALEAAKDGLAEFSKTANGLIAAMGPRAARAGASVELQRIDDIEAAFVNISGDLLGACFRIRMIGDRIAGSDDLVVAALSDLSGSLKRLFEPLDAEMLYRSGSDVPEIAVRQLADIEERIWPISRELSRLRADLGNFVGFGDLVLSLADLDAVAAFEQTQTKRLDELAATVERLVGPLGKAGNDEEIANLRDHVAELRELTVGPSGVLYFQRAIVDLKGDMNGLKQKMDAADEAYFTALTGLEAAARRLDEKARAEAIAGTDEAFRVMSVTALLLVLSGLAIATFVSRRVTRPIERLTQHVHRLRHHGDLDLELETRLRGRRDEIGLLARSFVRLVREVSEARRRLVAESEAEIRRQYDRLQAAIGAMPQGLYLVDREGRLIVHNKSLVDMYRFRAEQVRPGTTMDDLVVARRHNGAGARTGVDPTAQDVLGLRRPAQRVEELADGRTVVITASPTPDGGVVVTHEDITARRRAEAEIERMAHFDAMTDLANRASFRRHLTATLHGLQDDIQVALLHLDLDNFKMVNDTLGHPIGDVLLTQVATRLREFDADLDHVSRLGGDEFAIVQTGLVQPMAAADLATRIVERLSEPYEIEEHQVVIGVSIGIAVAPEDARDQDDLLKKADLALYRAKKEGRGIHRFFEPEMDARMQLRRSLELDLRRALVNDEFVVYYQPLVGAETSQILAFEALLRWRHPERGIVSPEHFIPLAEEAGLIGAIGAWVLRQATREAATWPSDIRVAVNISPVQFRTRMLTLDVLAALADSGLAPRRLELEVTESVLLNDTEATLETLARLREIGVGIAMDDFGTGYSSLNYLRKFTFDKIKIDQSFIRGMSDTADSLAIVRAVIGLCSSLGIVTTAEGVETEEQVDRLRSEGCNQLQGFLFGRPMPVTDVHRLLGGPDRPRLTA